MTLSSSVSLQNRAFRTFQNLLLLFSLVRIFVLVLLYHLRYFFLVLRLSKLFELEILDGFFGERMAVDVEGDFVGTRFL